MNAYDVYKQAQDETGIDMVLTGAKEADSLWRRRMLNNSVRCLDVQHPLKKWSKYDVLLYLKAKAIPIPDNEGGNIGGIGLSTYSLLWLYDSHREDYLKIRAHFSAH